MKTQARFERRGPQRYPTLGAAFAFVDTGEMIECVLRDISEEGACLQGAGIAGLPSRFELWLPTEGVSGFACIKWRNRHACGILFDGETARGVLRQRIARLVSDGDRTSRMVAILRTANEKMARSAAGMNRAAFAGTHVQTESKENTGSTCRNFENRSPGVRLRTRNDSIDHITSLVRSRLVTIVLAGRSATRGADILRRILRDLMLLRRIRD